MNQIEIAITTMGIDNDIDVFSIDKNSLSYICEKQNFDNYDINSELKMIIFGRQNENFCDAGIITNSLVVYTTFGYVEDNYADASSSFMKIVSNNLSEIGNSHVDLLYFNNHLVLMTNKDYGEIVNLFNTKFSKSDILNVKNSRVNIQNETTTAKLDICIGPMKNEDLKEKYPYLAQKIDDNAINIDIKSFVNPKKDKNNINNLFSHVKYEELINKYFKINRSELFEFREFAYEVIE